MLDIPESIKDLYKKDNITKKLKISFYDTKIDNLYPYEELYPTEEISPRQTIPYLVIENDRLVSESVKIIESLCDNSNLTFGSCEASQFEFECADIIEDIASKEIVVTQMIGNQYELTVGVYTITAVEKQADKRRKKVIAYDKMILFDIDVSDWYKSLAFPLSLKEFRDSLCAYINVTQVETTLINDDMQVTKTIDPKQISGRDVLKAICEINGCFGHFERVGILKYIVLAKTGIYPSETLYPDESLFPKQTGVLGTLTTTYYRSIDYSEYVVKPIDKLQIRQEEGDIGSVVGNGNNGYIVEGNFLVYGKNPSDLLSVANNLYETIKDRIYKPYKATTKGLPYVEVGDVLAIATKNDMIETFIFKRTLTGIQALTDEFKADGSEYQQEIFGVNKSIIQLQGKANILVRTVEELTNTLIDLEKGFESEISQTAEAISLLVGLTDSLELGLESAQSSIILNAQEIEFKVSTEDYNGDYITNLINIGTDGIKIDGSKIDLIGYVTFTSLGDLGETTISGGVFTSNIINGAEINGAVINGGSINVETNVDIGNFLNLHVDEDESYGESGLRFYRGDSEFATIYGANSASAYGIYIDRGLSVQDDINVMYGDLSVSLGNFSVNQNASIGMILTAMEVHTDRLDVDYINLGSGSMGNVPTVSWVESNFAPKLVFGDYATESWVSDNFASNSGGVDYVTESEMQSYVTGKYYATESFVTGKYYATESWVNSKYYATESWVSQNYAAKSWSGSYATESWVSQNYVSKY